MVRVLKEGVSQYNERLRESRVAFLSSALFVLFRLTDSLIKGVIFYLPTYTYQDVGDILLELMLLDRPSVCHWLESALKSLPQDENQPKVTQAQLVKFHSAVTRAEENHQVTEAIREFCRLWR